MWEAKKNYCFRSGQAVDAGLTWLTGSIGCWVKKQEITITITIITITITLIVNYIFRGYFFQLGRGKYVRTYCVMVLF